MQSSIETHRDSWNAIREITVLDHVSFTLNRFEELGYDGALTADVRVEVERYLAEAIAVIKDCPERRLSPRFAQHVIAHARRAVDLDRIVERAA